MKLHRLKATQELPITKEEAWKFLSDPANLKVITPPEHMGFKILSGGDRPMFPGKLYSTWFPPHFRCIVPDG